ncbi:hypothetical protein QBC37DRAFT_481483 [Rhypophila decipiens]|uniref:Uncharacterized protein n=1 Tax=Rhypophila decipiens TaxID=261697 RepID=A0AAN6YB74_9PEZI|nr:hypothetical protein QBC37DRAFT_481483 [Rhypophila decipiens]
MKRPANQPDDDVVMGDCDGAPPVPSLPGLSQGNTGETVVDGLQMSPSPPQAANTGKTSRDPQEAEAEQMKSLLDAERASTKALECKAKHWETKFQTLRRDAQNLLGAQEIDLETERLRREDVENKLREKSSEAQEVQKRWKQTARELNTLRSQQQGFGVITDDYLVNSVKRLRYNIQTFAIQFYGEKAPILKDFRTKGYFSKLFHTVENLESDVLSPERRATAIQAIIWWVLVDKVFGRFRWLGQAASLHAHDLHNILRPNWQRDYNHIGPRDAAAERKFQIWSASTAALLIELDHNQQGSSDNIISPLNIEDTDLLKGTLAFLAEIPTPCDPHGLKQDLCQILQEAIDIDKEISGQVARIEWDFRAGHTNMKFDPQYMVAAKEYGSAEAIDDVRLAIAPRMIKRGKSNGDDFETEYQLVPMEVSLMLASENGGGDGGVKAQDDDGVEAGGGGGREGVKRGSSAWVREKILARLGK